MFKTNFFVAPSESVSLMPIYKTNIVNKGTPILFNVFQLQLHTLIISMESFHSLLKLGLSSD